MIKNLNEYFASKYEFYLDEVKYCRKSAPDGAINLTLNCHDNYRAEFKGIIKEDGQIVMLTPQHWTPVSEEYPEREDRYLCTTLLRSGKASGLYIEICTYSKDHLYMDNGFFHWDRKDGFTKSRKVVAWMPLPEPYMEA